MTVETTNPPLSTPHAAGRAISALRWRLPAPSAEIVVFFIVALVGAWFTIPGSLWNADTHVFLTASIVDRASLNIDPFSALTGDIASAHGHFYADKAPGLSLAAVPVYALIRLVYLHGATYQSVISAPGGIATMEMVRYWLAVALAAIPTGIVAALLVWMARKMGAGPWWSLAIGLIYGLGTTARAFATLFFSHQFAACLIFSAYVILFRVRRGEIDERWTMLAGFLLGYAIVTENPTIIALAALGVYVVTAEGYGRRLIAWLALGVAPAALIYMLYNTLAFGGPLALGYSHLAGPDEFQQGQAQGVFGVTYPHLEAIWQTTFGPYRGIFLLSPVLLLAIPALILLYRRSGWRADALVCVAIGIGFFLFNWSYFAWDGGYSMGPRHVLPAVPFLILPIAELVRPVRQRGWRLAVGAFGAYSLIVVEVSAATTSLFDQRLSAPLIQWVLPRLAGMNVNPKIPDGAVAGLPDAFAHASPLFLSARLASNWGQWVKLPGLAQLWPVAIIACALLVWYACRTMPLGEKSPAREQIQTR
jgi:hypothetical protein